jgi:hypothetical protein
MVSIVYFRDNYTSRYHSNHPMSALFRGALTLEPPRQVWRGSEKIGYLHGDLDKREQPDDLRAPAGSQQRSDNGWQLASWGRNPVQAPARQALFSFSSPMVEAGDPEWRSALFGG